MTLKLHRTPHSGQTLLLALVVLALLAGALEVGARQQLDPDTRFTAIGSSNPTLDAKIGMLDRLERARGHIDCLFVGSSVVWYGIEPDQLAAAYTNQTGESLACFNMGIPAMSARGAAILADALVQRYHPRVLIYGFTLRALAQGASQADQIVSQLDDTAWLRYQRGTFDLSGWLIDQSAALRFYLPYRDWMRHDYARRMFPFSSATANGYAPFIGDAEVADPTNVNVPAYFRDYTPDPAEQAALAEVITLDTPETQVLLLEMPLPSFFLAHFETGSAGYMVEIDAIRAQAAAQGVALWSLTREDLIPLNGWAEDAHHVNPAGAVLLSQWLGAELAHAAQAGDVNLPVQ